VYIKAQNDMGWLKYSNYRLRSQLNLALGQPPARRRMAARPRNYV
jgi:hypothetical protein